MVFYLMMQRYFFIICRAKEKEQRMQIISVISGKIDFSGSKHHFTLAILLLDYKKSRS
jgi:hypothetical protein